MTTSEPVHFLIVDDREENLVALEAILRRDDLVLLRARSGTEALELLLRFDVALAFIDVQMPGMDGFELAELMRGMERTRRVPIIFLTASGEDWQRRFRGYEAGAVDFLHKPFEPDVLRSKADVFCDLYRQRQEVTRQRDELHSATRENARLLNESRQYAAALKDADARKDEFLAMLAHELRNPLSPLRNAVEILRLANHDRDSVTRAGEIISRQVEHMSRLVDDLLDVARIARGRIQIRREQCDLAQIVRHTAEDYRPTLASGVRFEIEISNDRLLIRGDPTRLAQVIGNLLHNAGKFTPPHGRIEVKAAIGPTPGSATVTIADNGAGMDATILAHLFEPFSQARQDLDRSQGGLGLGLALVKGLVELHGGSVAGESAGPGLGSKFTLTFPLSVGQPAAVAALIDETTAESTRFKILVIEDNRDAAESLRLLLELLGHEVRIAFDGKSGVQSARGFRPDVLFSDLGLPGELDGFAVAKTLRADRQFDQLYLVALSGYGQDEDRRRAAEAGFDQHLVKPIDPAALEATFAKLNPVRRAISPARPAVE